MLAVERISVGVEHEFFGAVAEVGDVFGVVGGDDYVVFSDFGVVAPVLAYLHSSID